MGFFTSKSETLLQSFADTLFKGFINSILIAGVAIVVTSWVEKSIELSKKRAALQTFNNDYLVKSADFLITSYANLSCARDPLLVATASCKGDLSEFVAKVDERKSFLTVLFPNSDFAALVGVASASKSLQDVPRDPGPDPQAIKQLIKQLTDQVSTAVNQITQNIE